MVDLLSFLSSVTVRIEDTIMALLLVLILQIGMMIISSLTKTSLNPQPLLFMMLRPIAIFLTSRLNKEGRSDFALIVRGLIVFTLLLSITLGLMAAFTYGAQYGNFLTWVNVILLALILSPFYPIYLAFELGKDTPHSKSFYFLSTALDQTVVHDDSHGIRRNSYRLLTVGLVEWFLAPILLYCTIGIAGAYVYMALCIFVRPSLTNPQRGQFLSVFLAFYRITQGIMACIAVLLSSIAAIFTPRGHPLKVLKAFIFIKKDVGVLAAYAYANHITLGGPVQGLNGYTRSMPWVGAEKTTAKLERQDVHRGLIMQSIILLLSLTALLLIYLYV